MGVIEEYMATLEDEPMPEGGPTWRQCCEMMKPTPQERLVAALLAEMQQSFVQDRLEDWERRLWEVPDGR